MPDYVPIICGHCGVAVSAAVLAGSPTGRCWLLCPHCEEGSYRNDRGAAFPPPTLMERVDGLPDDVERAWEEARRCAGVGAYTAAEIMCRKILMHIAVDKADSAPGKSFVQYVDDLDAAGYITVGLKPVIDIIRGRGNTANHELPASTRDVAVVTLQITEHLLTSTYALPSLGTTVSPEAAPAGASGVDPMGGAG